MQVHDKHRMDCLRLADRLDRVGLRESLSQMVALRPVAIQIAIC